MEIHQKVSPPCAPPHPRPPPAPSPSRRQPASTVSSRPPWTPCGLPTNGLYRDVTRAPGGDIHRYGLGVVGVSGAKRLTALLRTARPTP